MHPTIYTTAREQAIAAAWLAWLADVPMTWLPLAD